MSKSLIGIVPFVKKRPIWHIIHGMFVCFSCLYSNETQQLLSNT